MIFYKLRLGALGVNCYITGDKNEALVIDPGANAKKIHDLLQENDINVKYIVLTHCHFDHILAAGELKDLTGAKIVVSEKEKENLSNNEINMTGRFTRKSETASAIIPDILVSENDKITSGSISYRIIETPGHTSGGMCLYCEEENILFSGDTLFCESIGRYDFPTGDLETLLNSISKKLLCLPENTRVYPGHEAETTISHEIHHNPYLQ